MREDPALFKYELAIVLIAKNEAPYIREWIDYHLLAGVDHFYIYDNESEDDLEGTLKPYVDSGVVDYQKFPGKVAQHASYNDALHKHRFDCRYLAFIDADEFIRPIDHKQTIKDVLHELLDARNKSVGLVVSWNQFGSNGLEKAELEKGVLARFPRRAPDDSESFFKSIVNPRCTYTIGHVHFAEYFGGRHAINTKGNVAFFNQSPHLQDKMVINHYFTKSKEEFFAKRSRGRVASIQIRDPSEFDRKDHNEVFDDGIIKYREARLSVARPATESSTVMRNRLFNAMLTRLMAGMSPSAPRNLFAGKLHEFMTCLSIARSLRNNLLDERSADYFEELAIKCMLRSLVASSNANWKLQFLLNELPSLLPLKYPSIGALKTLCLQFIPEMLKFYRSKGLWRRYHQYDYLARMLKG